MGLLPAPNNVDLGDRLNTAGFRFNAPANNQGDQNTMKTDWNATNNLRLYFRYSWFKTLTLADSLNNAEATFPGQPNGTQGGIRSGYSTGDMVHQADVAERIHHRYSGVVGGFRPCPQLVPPRRGAHRSESVYESDPDRIRLNPQLARQPADRR